jgi:dTDP-D-glucose 4,6-dehydratase
MSNILITGGAGFIGSHVVRRFVNNYPNYNIYNLDKLTYAGNLENLKDQLKIDFLVYKIQTVRQYKNIFVRLLKNIWRIFSPDLIYKISKCSEKCGSGDIIIHIES